MSTEFFQTPPEIKNQYVHDALLRRSIETHLPQDYKKQVEEHLAHMGELAAGEMLEHANQAETNPPRHVPFDAWGNRVDDIVVSEGWKYMERLAAQEGLIATGYERKQKEFSRLYQMSLLYLYHPSSALFSCPLAMTDGAARAIELYGSAEMKSGAYQHLISRDPRQFWTSGQWMTEKTGGSDVSGTMTVAKRGREGEAEYNLWGTKWFTSATTAQMAMALARPEGAVSGSKGLSLFFVELRNQQGRLQNIQIHRLKDKLGTKALPTAELTLQGTPAQVVGGEGHGVRKISSLFNLTRIYNSVCALGHMRRALALAQDYSQKRVVFGKLLQDHILHQDTFLELVIDYASGFHLVQYAELLLGREENGQASEDQKILLRLLTPLCKLSTAKKAVRVTSEVVEIFGGAGYIEDTGLPRLLRDAHVFPIWEGTTNVLSLDVLRAAEKEGALAIAEKEFEQRLKKIKAPALKVKMQEQVDLFMSFSKIAQSQGEEFLLQSSRDFSLWLADLFSAFLMIEFAQSTQNKVDEFWATQMATRRLSRTAWPVVDNINRPNLRAFDIVSF